MGKESLKKDFYREIKFTFNRFVSIFLIVALGVAFFSGIRAAKPDMRLSADAFYDEYNLMDIRVLSTLGLTENDVKEISKIEGVKRVQKSYNIDVLTDDNESQDILEMLSLTADNNKAEVINGRLPEKGNECLIDKKLADKGYSIGDTIDVVSGTDDDINDSLNYTTYEIVGVGALPYYLGLDRGTSTLGTGSLSGFVVVMPQAFCMKAFTQIYVNVEGAEDYICYSDEYKDYVKEITERIENIAGTQCELRYDEVIADAYEEIGDAEEEIDSAKADVNNGEQELENARIKIEGGEQQLNTARSEIVQKENELNQGKQKLEEGRIQLQESKDKINNYALEIESGWNEYNTKYNEYLDGVQALNTAKIKAEKAMSQIEPVIVEYEAGKVSIEKVKDEFNTYIASIGISNEQLDVMIKNGNAGELGEKKKQLDDSERKIVQTGIYINSQQQKLEDTKIQLESKTVELKSADVLLQQSKKQLEDGQQQVDTGMEQIEQSEMELAENDNKINDGAAQIKKAKLQISEKEAELNNGRKEYEKDKIKADEELADARKQISDGETELEKAKQEVKDIKEPEWYVLDRQSLQTYVEYGQDADRIGAIGEVFPLIFFLVSALVCLTTMTRMVEEQRSQIGTMKALGYSDFDVAKKYILYAFYASLSGSILGLVTGQIFLPRVIIQAYKIMYANLPNIIAPLNLYYSVTSTLAAIICTTVAAYAACHRAFKSVPAELMRPEVPKSGKRILFERISFIWNKLTFTQKATFRNLFRYKKRFLMTIFGIGGCMGLILVGYGIKDSILSIGTLQFGEINIYQSVITLNKDADIAQNNKLFSDLNENNNINSYMDVYETSVDAGNEDVVKSAYIIVPDNPRKLSNYINLRDRISHEQYELDDDCIIITEKLAKLLNVSVGDSIILKDGDTSTYEVKISAISENYFLHYIFMSPKLYEKTYGKNVEYNEIYISNDRNDEEFEKEFAEEYLKYDAVSGVNFISSTADKIANMLKSMDVIIYVLIISAGILAFIVLYNLNNINITERRRELATLKVLGFYNTEVAQYVYRENIILTVLGILFGCVFGKILHRFVILTAEIDMLMFAREIGPRSYILSIIFTLVFTVVVNLVMYYQLKHINMVESLKSVE